MNQTSLRHSHDVDFVEFANITEAGQTLARDAARWIAAALNEKGHAFIAVPGGKSPAPFFTELAAADLDWSRVRVTLTDERFVPEDSNDSNSGLLRRTFLQGRAAAAQFVMPALSGIAISQAADAWDALLRAAPQFDLVVLGMGEDGHFASLFPGSGALADGLDPKSERFALAAEDRAPQRLSLTLRALLRTERLAFLISGAAKRAVLNSARGNERGADQLPISTLLRQSPVTPAFYWGAVT